MAKMACSTAGCTTWVFATVVLSLAGCPSAGGSDAERLATSEAKAEVSSLETETTRLKSEVAKLEEENRQFNVAKLEEENRRLKKEFSSEREDKQAEASLKEINRRLTTQVADLQLDLDDLRVQIAAAERPTGKVPRAGFKPDAPGVAIVLKPLPEEIEEDGSQCKECTNPELGTLKNGRLIACDAQDCDVGILRRRVKRSANSKLRISVQFPCPTCLGLTRIPCGTCRKIDHEFSRNQANVITGYLKAGRILWIEYLSVKRDLAIAKQARSERKIELITPRLEKLRKRYLENNYAIVAVFKQQLELCLRNVPRTEQPALRSRALKAIDAFSEAYNKGYYY
jgi:hypothetical protein